MSPRLLPDLLLHDPRKARTPSGPGIPLNDFLDGVVVEELCVFAGVV